MSQAPSVPSGACCGSGALPGGMTSLGGGWTWARGHQASTLTWKLLTLTRSLEQPLMEQSLLLSAAVSGGRGGLQWQRRSWWPSSGMGGSDPTSAHGAESWSGLFLWPAGGVGIGVWPHGLTPLHPHFLSDSASSNPKTPEGGHSSQEIKSETSSNPSSPEICPNKEK